MRRLDLISIRKKTGFDSLYLYIIMELHHITMLQKLSKCEVKAWLCCNLIFLPLLRFYVKSNRIQRVQVIKFDFSIFEQLSSPEFTQKCSESLKLQKVTFLDHLNSQNLISGKIGVAVKISNFNKAKP